MLLPTPIFAWSGSVNEWNKGKRHSNSPYISDGDKHAVMAIDNDILKLKLIYKIVHTDNFTSDSKFILQKIS